jgi:hypothetical protein
MVRRMITNKRPGLCLYCGAHVANGAGVAFRPLGVGWHLSCLRRGCLGKARDATKRWQVRKLTADGRVVVPYDPLELPTLRSMPGARWDKDAKCWRVSTRRGDRKRLLELAEQLHLDVAPALLERVAAKEEHDEPTES